MTALAHHPLVGEEHRNETHRTDSQANRPANDRYEEEQQDNSHAAHHHHGHHCEPAA